MKLNTCSLLVAISMLGQSSGDSGVSGECGQGVECPAGLCCSPWGYCGSGPDYCIGSSSDVTGVIPPISPPSEIPSSEPTQGANPDTISSLEPAVSEVPTSSVDPSAIPVPSDNPSVSEAPTSSVDPSADETSTSSVDPLATEASTSSVDPSASVAPIPIDSSIVGGEAPPSHATDQPVETDVTQPTDVPATEVSTEAPLSDSTINPSVDSQIILSTSTVDGGQVTSQSPAPEATQSAEPVEATPEAANIVGSTSNGAVATSSSMVVFIVSMLTSTLWMSS